MVEFLQFTLSGIVFGMIYAAVALSLVLIWRGTRLLNYGQGGMAMFGKGSWSRSRPASCSARYAS